MLEIAGKVEKDKAGQKRMLVWMYLQDVKDFHEAATNTIDKTPDIVEPIDVRLGQNREVLRAIKSQMQS